VKLRAMLIDDDADIRRVAVEVVESFGHECDEAASQEEAWQRLSQSNYDYVLLDLQIPTRVNGGFARVENGQNLLRQMKQNNLMQRIPVIVLTSHGSDGPTLAVKLMRMGAKHFVNKPFEHGELDNAIQEVVAEHYPKKGDEQPERPEPRRFDGGHMAFYEDRVELCGVVIRRNDGRGHAWQVLQRLREKKPDGRFVAYGSSQLARELGGIDQNAAIQCVNDLRDRISDVLLKELNVACDKQDVIMSGDQGYRLNPSIQVEHHSVPIPPAGAIGPGDNVGGVTGDKRLVTGVTCPVTGVTNAVTPGTAATVRTAVDESDLNERQRWVLRKLGSGQQLRRTDIEKEFGCADRTAKRDLRELVEKGLIEYVHETPSSGYYRFTRPAPVA